MVGSPLGVRSSLSNWRCCDGGGADIRGRNRNSSCSVRKTSDWYDISMI